MDRHGAWLVARRIRLCRRATGAAGFAKGAYASCRGAGNSAPRHQARPTVAHWPKAKNSGGLGAGPQGRGVARVSRLTASCAQAGSYGVVLQIAPFARTSSRGGSGRRLVRDTCRQAVAATVDGDDLGAVQQAVEDGSGGGNVA